ncbi:hypothetical protein AVEN_36633-1 [Araneus ventricosus]|uniref:Uncharacterized protein n=1 Tax=Araneus ventricosus TaxID=182803 RepID=A0A4Y2LC91_ARAVE|nr:hypothetical protein AVEN_36633-1 [Araneus ventricosus]
MVENRGAFNCRNLHFTVKIWSREHLGYQQESDEEENDLSSPRFTERSLNENSDTSLSEALMRIREVSPTDVMTRRLFGANRKIWFESSNVCFLSAHHLEVPRLKRKQQNTNKFQSCTVRNLDEWCNFKQVSLIMRMVTELQHLSSRM